MEKSLGQGTGMFCHVEVRKKMDLSKEAEGCFLSEKENHMIVASGSHMRK